jgi:hypothetical protein
MVHPVHLESKGQQAEQAVKVNQARKDFVVSQDLAGLLVMLVLVDHVGTLASRVTLARQERMGLKDPKVKLETPEHVDLQGHPGGRAHRAQQAQLEEQDPLGQPDQRACLARPVLPVV